MYSLVRKVCFVAVFMVLQACGNVVGPRDPGSNDDTDDDEDYSGAPAVGKAVAAGLGVSCALNTSGKAYCWGSQARGAIGNGGAPSTDTCGDPLCYVHPVPVSGNGVYSQIYSDAWGVCALSAIGAVDCWGRGTFEITSGTSSCPNGSQIGCLLTPTRAFGGRTFRTMSFRGGSVCGIETSGSLYCGSTVITPVPLASVAGDCGLTNAGKLYCWRNAVVSNGTYSSAAAVFPELTFLDVAAGDSFFCGVLTNHTAVCWGKNNVGQLGNGKFVGDGSCRYEGPECTAQPQTVIGGHSFDRMAAGDDFACGWKTDGDAFCWGLDVPRDGARLARGQGEVHCELFDCSPTPLKVAGSLKFVSIVAGSLHVCAIANVNGIYCWGNGTHGTLGRGVDPGNGYPGPVIPFN